MEGPIYLSGPMTGVPDFNFPLFNRVAGELRGMGHEVLNPAENDEGRADKSREHYLRLDLVSLSEAGSVVLLPGWENSEGCWMEVTIAQALDMQILFVYTVEPLILHDYKPPSTKLADQAKSLVAGPRRKDYGPIRDSLEKTGIVWGVILGIPPVPPRKVAMMMVALKVVRDSFHEIDDNIRDVHGYALMAENC